jgi:hypothetical protein
LHTSIIGSAGSFRLQVINYIILFLVIIVYYIIYNHIYYYNYNYIKSKLLPEGSSPTPELGGGACWRGKEFMRYPSVRDEGEESL